MISPRHTWAFLQLAFPMNRPQVWTCCITPGRVTIWTAHLLHFSVTADHVLITAILAACSNINYDLNLTGPTPENTQGFVPYASWTLTSKGSIGPGTLITDPTGANSELSGRRSCHSYRTPSMISGAARRVDPIASSARTAVCCKTRPPAEFPDDQGCAWTVHPTSDAYVLSHRAYSRSIVQPRRI